MTENTAKVIELLKSYTAMKRRIEQLRFELDNCYTIGEGELIENLALGVNPDGRGYKCGGHPSDKTLAIASRYRGIKNRMESEALGDIWRELRLFEVEVARLEHYVSLLPDMEGEVIKSIFFERKSWAETQGAMMVSEKTLSRHRKRAIDELAMMYSYLDGIKPAEKGWFVDNS